MEGGEKGGGCSTGQSARSVGFLQAGKAGRRDGFGGLLGSSHGPELPEPQFKGELEAAALSSKLELGASKDAEVRRGDEKKKRNF